MYNRKVSLAQVCRDMFFASRYALRDIVLFELIYKLMRTVIFIPLITVLLNLCLSFGGYKVAMNADILSFFASVPGLLAVLILSTVSVALVYYEYSVIVMLILYGYEGKHLRLRDAMGRAVPSFYSLMGSGILGFAVYALVLVPLLNTGLSSTLLPSIDIPNFILGELEKTWYGSAAVYALLAGIGFLLIKLSFSIPVMVLERKSFWRAAGRSIGIMKKNTVRFILLFILLMIAYGLLLLPLARLNRYAGEHSLISWQSLVWALTYLLVIVLECVLSPLVITLNTVYYFQRCGTKWVIQDEDEIAYISRKVRKTSHRARHYGLAAGKGLILWLDDLRESWFYRENRQKFWVGFVTLFVMLIGTVSVIVALIMGNPYQKPDPVVIGHRGSIGGVENTLGAIQAAVDDGADYAEIDILLSRDNVPMVIHDTNLGRLVGVKGNVYNYTVAELQSFTLSQNGYTSQISTLEQVIEFCQGKIKLNIEIKRHGREAVDVVDAVMEVVNRQDFAGHCIFQSLEYDIVQEIKMKYPEQTAGYIVYTNIGSMKKRALQTLKADFLVLEESVISKAVVKACHKAGMPVYVWTVDDPLQMARYKEMGVDGVITDYPKMAIPLFREAPLEEQTSGSTEKPTEDPADESENEYADESADE